MLNDLGTIDQWTDGDRFNWLHPTYGPFPDLCRVWEDGLGQYTVAVWAIDDGVWLAAACGPQAYHLGHLQTYMWEHAPEANEYFSFRCNWSRTKKSCLSVEGDVGGEEMLWILAEASLELLRKNPYPEFIDDASSSIDQERSRR